MSDRRAQRGGRKRQPPRALPLLLTAAFALAGLSGAQQNASNRLHLDFTEWDNMELGLPLPVPVVHMYDDQALTACVERGGDDACVEAATYKLPLLPSGNAERAAEELARAYRDLVRGVVETVDAEINQLPPCHAFLACLPGNVPIPAPDLPCLAARTLAGVTKGLAKHLPAYYAEVNRVIATHLPSHVASGGSVYPALDSVVAPVMDQTGAFQTLLGQLAAVGDLDDALAAAYRAQSLAAQYDIPLPDIPYLANQVEYETRAGRSLTLPGYRDFEAGKRSSEDLYDPDQVELGTGLLGLGAPGSLRAAANQKIAEDLHRRAAATHNTETAAKRVLEQYLSGVVPVDVIDHLAERAAVTIRNATQGEDLTQSLARALDADLARLASTLYTDESTAARLARAVDFQARQVNVSVPAFELSGALTVSDPALYEHIGYAGFAQVWPESEDRLVIYLDGFVPMPGIWVKCFGFAPTPVKIPWPVQVRLPAVARIAYVTVPEGYEVPLTAGEPRASPLIELLH